MDTRAKLSLCFQLDYCLEWIEQNAFRRIMLQFRPEDIKFSNFITQLLIEKHSELVKTKGCIDTNTALDVNVTQANTCCVDTIVTQHLTGLEAIIRFGKVCMSKPVIRNGTDCIPTLFIFSVDEEKDKNIRNCYDNLYECLHSGDLSKEKDLLVLYDANLLSYTVDLCRKLEVNKYLDRVEISKILLPDGWSIRKELEPCISRSSAAKVKFNQYVIENPVSHYKRVIYIGDRPSIQLALEGPARLFKVNCYDYLEQPLRLTTGSFEFNTRRLLNKRIALVERLKHETELRIGIIITNPLPDVPNVIERLQAHARNRKHTLYFISMIQTIDECKIGNFDLCDAFVVINSCTCSTILESLVFNRPILNELEFKLACGLEAEYGGVKWADSSDNLDADDLIIRRRVSDVSLALIQTRNELLERCSQARANMWTGLDFQAPPVEHGDNEGESLDIEQGLEGIASGYASERSIMKPRSSEPENS